MSPGRQVRAFGSYQYGLDGMRGYLIFCVFFYHARLGPYDGMYLMLSLFFVLSGFLITALLLDDRDRAGRIDYRRFIVRRVRRLAPAAFGGVLLAVIYGATIATKSQADALPGDILGVVFYVVNWTFIFTDQSYTDAFALPSPVQHYWSLALEEQFYVVIPVLLGLLLRFEVAAKVIGGVIAAMVAASSLWIYYLHGAGTDINRLYFGTDTRIAEVMAGVLLAVVMHYRNGEISERWRWIWSRAGWVAAAGLAYLWTTYGITEPFAYRGGFLLNSVLTSVLIMAIISQRGLMDRVFNWKPAVWVGTFSYGIYIYHFVILLWLSPERTGLDPWPNLGLVVFVTMVLAWASNKYFETPIRKGAKFGLPTIGQGAIYPVVGIGLVVAALLTANTDGDDPFATLRDDGRSQLAPVAAADGVLDLLVIHSAENAAIVDVLEEIIDDDDNIRSERAVFSCTGGVAEVDGSPTCASWATEWPALIEAHDPDTVLFFVDGWAGDDIATLEVAGAEGAQEVGTALLGTGFDLLTAQGAQIAAIGSGQPYAESFARGLAPFFQSLADLGGRPDVNLVVSGAMPDPSVLDADDYRRTSAETLLELGALYQRADREDRTRVLIIGDSQARSLGYGFERWGADRGIWVWNVATNGCGLTDEGYLIGSGTEVAIESECVTAVALLDEQVASFDPDLTIVLSSAWDIVPRRLDEWPEPKTLGTEEFTSFLTAEYVDVIETLTAGGGRILWMQAPCLDSPTVALGWEELQLLNREILPGLAEQYPDDIDLYDLDAILCPGGDPLREIDGVSPIRGDGVHFDIESSAWFAEKYGPSILETSGLP